MTRSHSHPREGANCDHGSRSVEGAVWGVSGTVLPSLGRGLRVPSVMRSGHFSRTPLTH